MISVIVPIYNVAPYLHRCVNSILVQTYPDFELILIDDGSTDGSGNILDSYSDPRIRIFHTTNHGLSAARNLGIEKSIGDFILFIDSDDWINPNTIETFVNHIGSADILCAHSESALYSGYDALIALLNGKISTSAWGKLYKRSCFSIIRFPENRICEDTATTYKLFLNSSQVICINDCCYHYQIRPDSLSHTHDKRNIIDYWTSVKERFLDCKDIVDDKTKVCLYQSCAIASIRTFAWRNTITELISADNFYNELTSFSREHFPYNTCKSFPLHIRICISFVKHPNKFSFWITNKILLLLRYCKIK